MTDTPHKFDRYQRQMLLAGVGREGQHRLGGAHAVIIGCGALGCGVADQLARAGIGRLTIVDRDIVEMSNLQRQVLFDERHVAAGLPKAEAARQRLAEINSNVRVNGVVADLNARTVADVLRGIVGRGPDGGVGGDLVLLDGTDNFETRLLINDLSQSTGIPYVYAGVIATGGMVLPILPRGWSGGAGTGACLRCLVERPPAPGAAPTCDTAGVLGASVGVATALLASEAMKILLGRREAVSPHLIEFDVWTGSHRLVPAEPLADPGCPCCVGRDFAYLEGRAGTSSVVLCGRGSVQLDPVEGQGKVDLARIAARLAASGHVTSNAFLVRVALPGERPDPPLDRVCLTVFRDGRAIVSGITRPERARSIRDRYLGG